jgi:hypothetical protein
MLFLVVIINLLAEVSFLLEYNLFAFVVTAAAIFALTLGSVTRATYKKQILIKLSKVAMVLFLEYRLFSIVVCELALWQYDSIKFLAASVSVISRTLGILA